ncbi:hypothetical protein GCM10022221_78750 [Actinocorallia aurea]
MPPLAASGASGAPHAVRNPGSVATPPATAIPRKNDRRETCSKAPIATYPLLTMAFTSGVYHIYPIGQ